MRPFRPFLLMPVVVLVASAYLPVLPDGETGSIVPGPSVTAVTQPPRNGYVSPDGLLWTKEGLWLADTGGRSLRHWSPDATEMVHTLQPEIVAPHAVVTDGRGACYFTDPAGRGVWRYRATILTKLAGEREGLRRPEGIAWSPDGRLLVGDSEKHAVFEVDEDHAIEVVGGVGQPRSMVFDATGRLFIVDASQDVLYVWTGGELDVALRDPEISLESVAVGQHGLLITDSRHGRVYRFDRDARPEVLATFGGSLRAVRGVTADDAGHLYVAVRTKPLEGHLFRLTLRAP